jgi:hypothetical protein
MITGVERLGDRLLSWIVPRSTAQAGGHEWRDYGPCNESCSNPHGQGTGRRWRWCWFNEIDGRIFCGTWQGVRCGC